MFRRFICVLCVFASPFISHALTRPVYLSLPERSSQVPGGLIFFRLTDAKASSGASYMWQYKPTRWGMYEVVLLYPRKATAPEGVQIEVAGHKFASLEAPAELFPFTSYSLGRFYLAKAEPFEVRLRSSSPGGLTNVQAVLLRPAPEGKPIVQVSDFILLRAGDATTHSVMMRYEPATNKNCLGFWTNPTDSATWKFDVTKPGAYEIELWQGCGKGQGGSEVSVLLDKHSGNSYLSPNGEVKRATFVVEETGHFQNFVPRNLGQVSFPEAGPYVLTVRPMKKKADAVMDIQQIVLKPASPESRNTGSNHAPK